MTRELIIEGQHVDLAPDTDITLEYVNNLLGDIGKISLSHSYTVKLPKTTRNARILDDPDNVSHQSRATRRYLSARFYRNGIDLIGPAQAYILKTTPESYEIALVWNTLEALQTLSQSDATLNDLPDLPVLTWIGPDGKPDYTANSEQDGALFAEYASGLGTAVYPTVLAASNPAMRLDNLIRRILDNAGVRYVITDQALLSIKDVVLLASNGRKPSLTMEMESGCTSDYASVLRNIVQFGRFTQGWDSPYKGSVIFDNEFLKGDSDSHRVRLNLFIDDPSDNIKNYVTRVVGFSYKTVISQGQTIHRLYQQQTLWSGYFKPRGNGWALTMDEEISVSGWDIYAISVGVPALAPDPTPLVQGQPMLVVNRVHPTLRPDKDNRFPLEGNLPDIKQWDLINACAALFGWAIAIHNGRVDIKTVEETLDTYLADDWSAKIDMTEGGLQDLSYSLSNWAQRNTISYTEDAPVNMHPNADLIIQDLTLAAQKDRYKLPFAASVGNQAVQYNIKGEEVDDVDIKPRIFSLYEEADDSGVVLRHLRFTEDLYGDAIKARYARLQDALLKPVIISANIRLNELDLAGLDITRPVYFAQFGHYYAILKVQTSETDLCKVELIQLP